jgi:hypothetical protein
VENEREKCLDCSNERGCHVPDGVCVRGVGGAKRGAAAIRHGPLLHTPFEVGRGRYFTYFIYRKNK